MLGLDELLERYGPERLLSEMALAEARAECERDLLAFVRRFWRVNDRNTPLIEGWPLEAICDHLMAVTDGHIKRLIMNVPPGCTKSLTVDVFWPAWEWGPMALPWLRYHCFSHSEKITTRDNGRFLRICQDDEYRAMWGHVFRITRDGEHKIENNETGFKHASSISGESVGLRGNRIIIDDPNSTDPKKVESDAEREGVNGWIREVMPDRLNDLAEDVIVLIQQRTGENDATGTLLDIAGLDYVHLCLPAEYDPLRHCITVLKRDPETGEPLRCFEDPRGLDDDGARLEGFIVGAQTTNWGPKPVVTGVAPRSPAMQASGLLLWPERLPADKLEEQKRIKGPVAYAGQYLQSPTARGGNILKAEWWRLWDKPDYPDFVKVIFSLDTAQKEKEENDYNALTMWGIWMGEGGHWQIMLIGAWKMRCDLSTLVARVGKDCKLRKADYLLIEDKTRGYDVAGEIRREFGARAWSTVLVNPPGDKVSRALSVQPIFSGTPIERVDPDTGAHVTQWAGGIVWAPDKQFADDVIAECRAFPKGVHDDYVDSVTQAIRWMRDVGFAHLLSEWQEAEMESRRYRKPKPPPYDI